MNILEKEIEDVIWEATGPQLIERGLRLKLGSLKWRQLNLGPYGIADIVTVKLDKVIKINKEYDYKVTNWVLRIDVIELKKEEINIATFLQALEYCKGLERFFNKAMNIDFEFDFNIILIGKKIETDSSFCFMADFCKNLSLYTYGIDLEKGVRFTPQYGFHHHVSTEVFPNSLFDSLNISNAKTLLEKKKQEVVYCGEEIL